MPKKTDAWLLLSVLWAGTYGRLLAGVLVSVQYRRAGSDSLGDDVGKTIVDIFLSWDEYTMVVSSEGVSQVALQFQKTTHSCLRRVLSQVQNMEQTQEIRIPEGMPGIERVVSAWGQVVMRSKDWQGSSIQLSAGMLVWVLYMDEAGSAQRAEGWIPFQIRWDLPESCPDGQMRILCVPRYVDARSVSAGKIMVRAGVSALAEAWCPGTATVWKPEDVPEDIQLLTSAYPVRLPREAGEKSFLLEEELTLPGSAPVPAKVISWRMDPAVTDKKVMSNRVVFRGNGNLHVLYEAENGQLHTWDFELPFSHFSDLEGSYSQDAQADLRLMVTNAELECAGGKFQLKGAVVAQYLVDDREILEVTEDAYSPSRQLKLEHQMLELPALLEDRRENIYGELMLPGQADIVTDVQFLGEFPRQRMEEDRITLDQPGMVQMLYYDANGMLQSAVSRWEGKAVLPSDAHNELEALPLPVSQLQVHPGGDSVSVRGEVPVQLRFSSGQGLPMVMGIEVAGEIVRDPGRPSLVIRRQGSGGLWELAKAAGSTMEAIREANHLADEPAPGQLLLIPIP